MPDSCQNVIPKAPWLFLIEIVFYSKNYSILNIKLGMTAYLFSFFKVGANLDSAEQWKVYDTEDKAGW